MISVFHCRPRDGSRGLDRCAVNLKDPEAEAVVFGKMNGAEKTIAGVFVTILAAGSLLFGAFWILLTILFIQNFHHPNLWHFFIFLYTVATPVASTMGYFLFWFRPSVRTALFSVIASLAVGATYFLWTSDVARGLIH